MDRQKREKKHTEKDKLSNNTRNIRFLLCMCTIMCIHMMEREKTGFFVLKVKKQRRG